MTESALSIEKRNRWQMNRAGILNFWFYEDEEFELEEGRLVLRGTNGAGKSVTMQSFIPLVLDGDKHPNRLDPFGSRDRKIEYYLLGDKEEHTDRTGYLWLEFYHPAKNIYKTIGIGLRARKGVAQLGFWGFVLEDGRRINKDFWLYDRVTFLEGNGKYPLDRKSLEDKIGAGGQVVQEQRTYRDLVNRSLFGFHDKESYVDLLNLLIQLRSPKLSKDVKPTAIYEILNRALPPLQEEELRPLSEVMEDMDQLADRLEELKLHQTELEKLNRIYTQYNRYMLYRDGKLLLQAKLNHEQIIKESSEQERALHEREADKTELELLLLKNSQNKQTTETGLELLDQSEVLEKQKELERTEADLSEATTNLEKTNKRIRALEQKLAEAQYGFEKSKNAMESLLVQQSDGLFELEQLAGEIEFYNHSVYHHYWNNEPPEQIEFIEAWRKDVEEHRKQIHEALQLAVKEQEAYRLVQEYDKQLGERRLERDQAEHVKQRAIEVAEKALYEWKEGLLTWKESLQELQLSDAGIQKIFEASSTISFDYKQIDTVFEYARVEAQRVNDAIKYQKLEQEQQLNASMTEKERLMAEKKEWEQAKEPEPIRSVAKLKTRRSYQSQYGAPLYEVCEFLPHISSAQRASIELSLLQAGILDAWIYSDGQYSLMQDDLEEVWMLPEPIEWGYTLADVLRPVASEESGLKNAQVDAVLRSIAWGEGYNASSIVEEQSKIVIGVDYYQLGSLIGKVDASQYTAQFIGKEARRQFKLAEIERLSNEIDQVEQGIANMRQSIAHYEDRLKVIDAELTRFPIREELHQHLELAWQQQYEAETHFKVLLEQETKLSLQLREKQQFRDRLKQELISLTSKWSRLQTLKELQAAEQAIGDYWGEVTGLVSEWKEYKQNKREVNRLEAEIISYKENIEADEETRDEWFDKEYGLRTRKQKLEQLMEELGFKDISNRILLLKQSLKELDKERETFIQDMTEIISQIRVLLDRKQRTNEQLAAVQRDFEAKRVQFAAELALKLVPETEQLDHDQLEVDVLKVCQDIVTRLDNTMGSANQERLSGALQDQFTASKHLLGEYVLEADISDVGRITLMSMRDRMRPQKPSLLILEMKDMLLEQEALLSEKDRELFEEIILRSVGKSIRHRIQRAELWLGTMNTLMSQRNTSSGLKLQLRWVAKAAQSENELNSDELVALLRKDAHLLHDDEVERLIGHFRSRVQWAKQSAVEEREALRKHIYEMLDYRSWFQFSLHSKKGSEASYRELTDSRFNVMSGGEKAMSMYIPLFAATYSRYADANPDSPKIISLDEAFAGVDEENIRDMFGLLTEMDFDYMMTSQMLWGCYDTVPTLSICEIYRPKDANYLTILRYKWDGNRLESIVQDEALL